MLMLLFKTGEKIDDLSKIRTNTTQLVFRTGNKKIHFFKNEFKLKF